MSELVELAIEIIRLASLLACLFGAVINTLLALEGKKDYSYKIYHLLWAIFLFLGAKIGQGGIQ